MNRKLTGLVSIKIPKTTYIAVKAAAGKRGCFIGKIIADAVTLYFSTQKPDESKEQAA
jgi:hypothetical protein